MAVVGSAAELDVLDRRLAAGRSRHDVVELDETPFTAAMPVHGDQRASRAVSHVDGAPDVGRDVACVLRLSATATRVRSGREFPAHQLVEERRQRPIEHLCHVAGGNGTAEQVLRASVSRAFPPSAVKRTSYRSAAMGRTVGRAGAGMEQEMAPPVIAPAASGVAEDSVAAGSPTSGAAPTSEAALIAGEAPIGGTVAIAAVCTFRTDASASASGMRAASSSSTSSLPNPEAAESSSRWFSGVSRRASSRAVVGLRVHKS